MNAIIYLLQVSACMAIFYGFYYFMLNRLTFFTINRYYLLFTLILSFVIPLLTIPVHNEYVPVIQQSVMVYEFQKFPVHTVTTTPRAAATLTHTINWPQVLKLVYLLVAIALFVHLLIVLTGFFIKLKYRKINRIGRVHILHGNKNLPNGSFLNYIFLNDDELSHDELQQIIAHEMLHVKLLHSIDRIIAKIVQILLWFNPFVYLYARSIEENHEFEVDREIARSTNKNNYAELLLHLSVAKQGMLYHNFSTVPLKKRIAMLFDKPSSKVKRVVYIFVIPVIVISCLAFAKFKNDHANTPVPKADEQFKAWRKTDDYKKKWKLQSGISGKIVTVKVKNIIKDAKTGKQTGFMITHHGNNYILNTGYGQAKELDSLIRPGEEIKLKAFSAGFSAESAEIHVSAGEIFKNNKMVFQRAEEVPIPQLPFSTEPNKVNYAEGQITHIEKYPNGKWKSAVLEEVNGYRFNLNFNANVPDLDIADGDHVRLRFVNEIKSGDKQYIVNDWVSLTNNENRFGRKNPDLFYKFYTNTLIKTSQPYAFVQKAAKDTARFTIIPGLRKLGNNPLVLIDGKEYPADILYQISYTCIKETTTGGMNMGIKQYGSKATDGFVDIKTKHGTITYLTQADKENVININKENLAKEAQALKDQFYARIPLKNLDGTYYDKIVIRWPSGVGASDIIPTNAKVGLVIDGHLYSENDFKKLLPMVIPALKPKANVGTPVHGGFPGVDVKGYDFVFELTTKPGINTMASHFTDDTAWPANSTMSMIAMNMNAKN